MHITTLLVCSSSFFIFFIQASLQNRVKGSGKKGEVGSTSLVSTNTNEDEQPPSELTARRMHALRYEKLDKIDALLLCII